MVHVCTCAACVTVWYKWRGGHSHVVLLCMFICSWLKNAYSYTQDKSVSTAGNIFTINELGSLVSRNNYKTIS